MEDYEPINQRDELITLKNEIIGSVYDSLENDKDEEGFAFLTNSPVGKSAPIDFAREFGFRLPIFKVKEAKRAYENQDVSDLESWWVKEGLMRGEKNENR